jgi:hypothetical protein
MEPINWTAENIKMGTSGYCPTNADFLEAVRDQCLKMTVGKPLLYLSMALLIDIIEPFVFTHFFDEIRDKKQIVRGLTYETLFSLMKLLKKAFIVIAIIMLWLGMRSYNIEV